MINPEVRKILEGVNATPFGRALKEFLDDEMVRLNDVSACTSWEDVLGRKQAIKTIQSLFSFMKSPTDTEKNTTNPYV